MKYLQANNGQWVAKVKDKWTDTYIVRVSSFSHSLEENSTFSLDVTLATQEQIDWLEACITANKYLPPNKFKIVTPEIY